MAQPTEVGGRVVATAADRQLVGTFVLVARQTVLAQEFGNALARYVAPHVLLPGQQFGQIRVKARQMIL